MESSEEFQNTPSVFKVCESPRCCWWFVSSSERSCNSSLPFDTHFPMFKPANLSNSACSALSVRALFFVSAPVRASLT